MRAKPRDIGMQRARVTRQRLGSAYRLARVAVGMTQEHVATLAGVSQEFVSAVERGVRAPSLEIGARIAAAVGYELSVRLYPAAGVGLRDSGQVALIEGITAQAARVWHARIEVPVADGDRRAADLIMQGFDEILHVEAEGGLVDLQAQVRAAQLKREALAARYDHPVRLIIAVPDRRSIRRVVAAHAGVLSRTLAAPSATIWRAIRAGFPVVADGILFVRAPERPDPARPTTPGTTRSR